MIKSLFKHKTMKYIIICIISTILAKFSIAQTTSNYPLIFEGYPYFDEYGLPTDKNVTLMHNGSPTFPLCSPYLPYLFNFNNCIEIQRSNEIRGWLNGNRCIFSC